MANLPDENDRLRAGTLPDDPEADAEVMLGEDEMLRVAQRAATVEALQRQRVGTFLTPALARMRARALDQERPIALPWPSMNDALAGGFWPGLHVLVGNTGTGKSQWALQGALHAARTGIPVLYIGLELGDLDLVARLLGLVTHRKWSRLFLGRDSNGKPNVAELDAVEDQHAEQLGELASMPFHLEVCPPMGWSYGSLYEKAAAMRAIYPEALGPDGAPRRGSRPFLVVLDFLQLVASPEGREREELRERIGRAAYAGRAVARDLDAAVVLVSSTSRENYGTLDGVTGGKEGKEGSGKEKITPGTTPVHRLVGFGKESGEVEYAADSVIVFVRENGDDKSDGFTSMHLAIAKTRARSETAGNGWVKLRFNGGWFEEPRALERGVSG